jgi:hypothetical protein
VLHSDPSSLSSIPSFEKCDSVVAKADRVTKQIPLAVATSIQPSSSCATEDSDTTKEDDPSAHSSTKFQTRAVELRRASSSASVSHHATCSTPSYLASSSSRPASQAQSEGCPRIRSQTLALGLSRCDCAPPSSIIRQSACPQLPPERLCWASTRA